MTDNQVRLIALIDQARRDVDDVIACLDMARNNVIDQVRSDLDDAIAHRIPAHRREAPQKRKSAFATLAWALGSLSAARRRVADAMDVPEST